jgi:hypothetical protein
LPAHFVHDIIAGLDKRIGLFKYLGVFAQYFPNLGEQPFG